VSQASDTVEFGLNCNAFRLSGMVNYVFSYGTLRLPKVQRTIFGREVPTHIDALSGYSLQWLTITDREVIATSGTNTHPILMPGRPTDRVDGACLELSDDEVLSADNYEVADYARVLVTLISGREAWVYLDSASSESGRDRAE
jgi:hypothetical protein